MNDYEGWECGLPPEIWVRMFSAFHWHLRDFQALETTCKEIYYIIQGLECLMLRIPKQWPESFFGRLPYLCSLSIESGPHKGGVELPSSLGHSQMMIEEARNSSLFAEAFWSFPQANPDGEYPITHKTYDCELPGRIWTVVESAKQKRIFVFNKHWKQADELMLSSSVKQAPHGFLYFASEEDHIAVEEYHAVCGVHRVNGGLSDSLMDLKLPYRLESVDLLPKYLHTLDIRYSCFSHLLPFPRTLTSLKLASLESPFGCPPELQLLHVYACEDDPNLIEWFNLLPVCLTSFLHNSPTDSYVLESIPPTVTSLGINLVDTQPSQMLFLNRSLKSLRFLDQQPPVLTEAHLEALPLGLEHLHLGYWSLTNALVPYLPQNLKSIKFFSVPEDLSYHSYAQLPRGVQLNHKALPYVYRPMLAQQYVQGIAPDWLEALWPSWLSFAFPVSACGVLPRNMRTLKVDGAHWTGSALQNLPPMLQSLTLSNCRSLTPEDMSYLPETLTELILPAHPTYDAIMERLPENLTLLEFTGSTYSSNGSHAAPRFPATLTSLHLNYRFTYNGVTDVQFPPQLATCMLYGTHFVDAWCALLPPSLTYLIISDDALMSDAGIEQLPRALTLLSLPSNPNITDSGICLLPPHLRSLILPRCENITDAAVLELPRTLTHIAMWKAKFTYDSIEFWPPGLVCGEFDIQEPEVQEPEPAYQFEPLATEVELEG